MPANDDERNRDEVEGYEDIVQRDVLNMNENEDDDDNEIEIENENLDQPPEIEVGNENLVNDQADIAHGLGTDIATEMDRRYGVRGSEYNLRPRKPRDYSHLHGTLDHIALTQYNLKQGLAVFGKAGIEAIRKELMQLHDR